MAGWDIPAVDSDVDCNVGGDVVSMLGLFDDAGIPLAIGLAVVGEGVDGTIGSTYGKPEHSLKSTTHGALHSKHSSLKLSVALWHKRED